MSDPAVNVSPAGIATRLAALPITTRRAIAIGGLALLLVLAWILVVMPLAALTSSQQEWREDTRRQIAQDRGLAKSAADLRAAATRVHEAPIRARLFDSAAALGVDNQLQEDLRNAMRQSGVEPTTFRVLPGTSGRGLRQHRVEFSTIMTVEQARAMFMFLAQQPRYVRIETMRIEAPNSQRPNENPSLNLLIEAQGYALDNPAAPANMRVASAN